MAVEIPLDIETIPDQSENALDRFMSDDVKVTCPFKTKAETGKALGLSEPEYKFISSDDLKLMWINENAESAKAKQAEEKWLKTSFDGGYGQICCIGYDLDGTPKALSQGSESDMLREFWSDVAALANGRSVMFIAHNAKFDLPFIHKRSIINGVRPTVRFNPHGRHGQDFYCTMEAWAGFNGRIGLDRLAGILGLGSKTEGMSGADVWPEYQKGNIDKIAAYCLDDVALAKAVHRKLEFKDG